MGGILIVFMGECTVKTYQKRLAVLALVLLTLMTLLPGCTNESDNFDYIPKADEYYDDAASADEPEREMYGISVENFSSGRAWIKYSYQYEEIHPHGSKSWTYDGYFGCINKEGEVLFAYPDQDSTSGNPESEKGVVRVSEFHDGVAYMESRDNEGKTMYWVIDENGDILTSFAESDFGELLLYSDGYFLFYEDQSNFSGASNCYRIVDFSGTVLKEIVYAKDEFTHSKALDNNLRYLGDGIFAFWLSLRFGDSSSTVDFYNIPEDIQFTYSNLTTNHRLDIKFQDGAAFVKRNDMPNIVLFTDGTCRELSYDSGHDTIPDTCYAGEGKVVLGIFHNNYGGHDPCLDIVYYSIEDDAYYPLDALKGNMYLYDTFDDYCDAFSGSFNYKIVNDRFLVHLLGADGLSYVGMVDMNNEVVLEPVRCDRGTEISCGRLVVISEENGCTVYDTDGNVIVSGEEVISTYQDDVAKVDNSDRFIDLQGNDLFDELDFSTVEIKTVS